ncbi:AAA family ATPase [Dendronalium sp. ChiSLP03b]|uniref:trifunctional serine/threonine-protein kinase/ATP-binding protein/sensor histidine kinase n=1 Tax=Dendronalium sp. ChiSLP03b TaxID=3075381 RepID=UPI002AD3F53F|nr:AAA family ATPase [Dendronalium sp. ChiSLP03b]MDZ8206640.1 AAA family ATPase [Dendronalium sp. ChiSLP03b]
MSAKVNRTVRLAGYQITEQIYSGSRTVVYRAIRECDRQPVVIKLLKREYPSFSELVQFRNQYAIAKNLNIPGIIQPYSLEPYDNAYALVMEDFGGISLQEFTQGKILTLEQFLAITLQLLDTLHQLHQQRVIHKDIKPANILIHPDTKQIKLIDFSIASLLPRETQEIQSPNRLEGTLAYLSPEQTGRMNRGIDYRSDFYSLGVTFFELLSGQLPFESHEPMELVHYHIAKQPPFVYDFNPNLPLMLGEIVRKLMAKNAEDRYQSALGLKHDLAICLEQWQQIGKHTWFELGQRDISDRFLIREKLYGRESEVQTLLEAFGHVANGDSELMLVAGFSGIGKTAVVNEVHKPIVRWKGYFIKGKFDQFNRNIPLSAFVQAFRDLIGQLLSESDTQLEQWQSKILAAVGENGQLLIEVIPELEQIIGKQSAIAELSGSAAQNRFNLLFQKFIQVFTTPEHPLVMFLDDLQWADSASLNLLKLLMAQSNWGYLFIIGAYRDNEVFAAHPLMLTLDEIEKASSCVNTLTLAPLSQADVNHLIADSLSCTTEQALPLTELVYQKAKGNPFFTTQFLKALHEDGLIIFDWEAGFWQCDVAQVRSLALTDDVVEFMAQQLQKLPPNTQDVLKLAACIGNQFDLATLAIVYEKSQTETAADLWKALQEGFVIPTNDIYKFYQTETSAATVQTSIQKVDTCAYKFLHDRVQQAAYLLIPEGQKQATHLKIGQLLQQNYSEIEQEEKLFDIVGHLNLGQELITQPSDRQELAELNLVTGQKAITSTAYAAAMVYLQTAMGLLTTDCWQNQYELTLNIYVATAEAEYLNLNFEGSLNLAEIAMIKVNNLLDKVKVYELKMQIHIAQLEMVTAVDIGLEVLEKLTIYLLTVEVDKELIIDLPNLDDLDNLPTMTDPYKLAAMQILKILCAPVFMAKPEIFPQIIITMINLCLQYGNSSISSFAYGFYGLLLVGFSQIDRGYHAGLIALKLLDKFNAKELKAKVYNLFNSNIRTWKEHAKNSIEPLREGVQAGLEVGDLEWGGYCAANLCSYLFFTEDNLESAVQQQRVYVDLCINIKQEIPIHFSQVWRQLGLNLQRQAEDPLLLIGESFDEEKILPRIIAAKSGTVLFVFYVAKTILLYLLNDSSQALKNVELAQEQAGAAFGFMQVVVINFYHSLTLLNCYNKVTVNEQEKYFNQVNINQEKMKFWAENAPEVNQHKYELIEAEKVRVLGINWQAAELYDSAILGAKKQGYVCEEALANELAAKFYLDWGKQRIAQEYMTEAYYGYARWGAKAKVADLEQRYPQLLAPILQQTRSPFSTNETIFTLGSVTSTSSATSSSSSVSVALDLATILKASQTLSGEIELEKLLSALLHIVIENAGADKCVFMLLESGRLLIQALAQLSQNAVQNQTAKVDFYPMLLNPQSVEDSVDVPVGLINTVKRSLQAAVIMDPTVHPQLINDPYIQQQQPKSILCSPILHQGKLLGILYLENNLATGAFTSDRVELLNLLCTQVAISLENARLYAREQEKSQSLQASLAQLKQTEASLAKEREFLNAIIHNITDGIVVCDASGKLTLFNNATREFHGLPVESLPPEQWAEHFDLYQPDGQTPLSATEIPLFRALQGEIVENAEMVIAPKHGSKRILLVSGQAIVDSAGNKIGAVVVMRDISDRKLAELALQQKSLDLEQALTDLQNAQLQIVQSEKMSALGNLVAGVAHEMNNPLGFIAASLKQAKPTVADIVEHLKLYQETLPNASDEILNHAAEIDLDYSLEDLPKMFDSMAMACDRLKNISTSLRTFSRADKDYKVPFNIHQGIDSTILILKHRLKANEQRPAIEVITEYTTLPEVECFPGQLNQVFMNILANAIDALEESNIGRSFDKIKANPNCITITTTVENNLVKITIADNGKGITEEVKQKVFDHLFTTKAVGKGTGLGLAIAKSIIEEKHKGTLAVNSTLGKGTEFVITLPILAQTQD